MGVMGMWEYMQKFVQPVDISTLRNKRIAIDGHLWLCEVVRGSVAHSSGAKKPHLSAFYNRCRSLLEKGIEPIVVFDSVDDTARLDVQNNIPMKKDRKHGTGIWAPDMKEELITKIEEIKVLLNAMGVRWLVSKLEGEAQCAQLEQRGLVHGCITRDFDYVLFGGNNLYQVEFGPGGKTIHDNVLLLSMDYLSEKLCLSRSCLIAMSLMMGCDYYQKGVPGVGVVTALEIVSEFYIMNHDHPQVILDRFKSYAMESLPVRESDSPLKKKLRSSCLKQSIDVREFNPNSETVANAINVYVIPCVIEYARTQLPKKRPPDLQKTQEILMKECDWDPNRATTVVEKSVKKQAKEKNSAVARCRPVVAACSKEEGACCSKREWAAMERLRSNANLYKFSPVIEVISVPSTSEEPTLSAARPGNSGTLGADRRGPKRRLTSGDDKEPASKQPSPNVHSSPDGQSPTATSQEELSPTTSGAVAQYSLPIGVMRPGEAVEIDEQPSDSASDVIVIEDIPASKNALQVIQSTA